MSETPFEQRTLPALLDHQAATFEQRALVRVGNVELSYREVRDLAARSGGRLLGTGIAAGDRVAMMSENRLELLELILGCAWVGAIAVPINTASRGPQLEHILSNCGARLLVHEAAQAELFEGRPPPVWRFEDLPPAGSPAPAADVAPADTAAILYTSGTTGPSKGVRCPHAQLY